MVHVCQYFLSCNWGSHRGELVTYIAATDPGIFDVDEHIMRVFEFRNWPVFKTDLVNTFQNEGEILVYHVSVPVQVYRKVNGWMGDGGGGESCWTYVIPELLQ